MSWTRELAPFLGAFKIGRARACINRQDSEATDSIAEEHIVITDRHVVIAQEGTGTLRFYSHTGSLETVVGGRGEGPGEFGDLQWVITGR